MTLDATTFERVAPIEVKLEVVALLLHMLLCVADVERRLEQVTLLPVYTGHNTLENVALLPLMLDATRLEVDVML